MASTSEPACVYSAPILHDDEVTEDKLNALANTDVNGLICNIGAGSSAPATAAVVSTAAPVAAQEKKQEKKQEGSEESDDDMGFGLFD
ncbi:large ribosomal subunit protein P1-like [Scyliorhinus torazame]|uniref:large ribosomal subunit protein P1-like n=1 Tax=Scyliorhinus torazame TaxID=75743 RepID=UPI003B5AF0FC